MKQLGKKLTLVVLMFLSVVLMFCGAFSLRTMAGAEEEDSAPKTYTVGSEEDWYLLSYSRDHLTLLLDGDYRTYLDGELGDVKALGSGLVSAMREIIIESILKNPSGIAPHAANVSHIVAFADTTAGESSGGELPNPGDFDWNNSELLKEFRDYVQERLSRPEELEKYLEGEYDMLLEYAVGSYVESQGGKLSNEQKEKVEEKIQEVVDTAKDNVDEYFVQQEKQIEAEKKEIEDKLASGTVSEEEKKELEAKQQELDDKAKALDTQKGSIDKGYEESKDTTQEGGSKLGQLIEKVDEAGGAPQITLQDIISKFTSLYVNGRPLYLKVAGPGEEAGLNVSTLRYLLTLVPRPGELADYTEEQMRSLFEVEVGIETTYGNINFDLTFGFKGDTAQVKKAAKYVADHVNVAVDGHNVAVELLSPEAVTKALRKTVESAHFTDAQKNLVFSVFGKTTDEIYDKLTSYTYEDLLNFLKGIDYKAWFSNFTNAEFIQGFFGSYLTDVLGHPLTNENIDNLIDRLHNFFAPKLDKLATMTVKEVEDWLKANVPGMNRVNVPGKVERAAERLLSLVQKVNWSNYDAKTIRELLQDEDYDLNSKIYSYLERLDRFDDLYDTFLSYIEKVYKYIPESLKDGKIVNLYDGTKFAYEGEYTVDLMRIVNKLTSMAENRGYEQVSDLLGKVKTLLADKRTEYTVDLSLELTVPHLHKVTYMVGDTAAREGFLPCEVSGKTVATLSNLPEIEGYKVLGWMKQGERYEDASSFLAAMPDEDVVLVPVTEFTLMETVDGKASNSLTATYTVAKEYALGVDIEGVGYAEGHYTYAWYKDDGAEPVSEEETLTLAEVADNGVYRVVVTDDLTGYAVTSEEIEVTIQKQVIEAVLEWTVDGTAYESGKASFIYNEKAHEVAVAVKEIVAEDADKAVLTVAIFENTTLTEDGHDHTSAGTYEETLTLALTEEYAANYELEDTCVENTFVWTIEQLLITNVHVELVGVSEGNVPDAEHLTYIYTGKEIEVKWEITIETNDPEGNWTYADLFNEITSIKHTNAGVYEESFGKKMGEFMSAMKPEVWEGDNIAIYEDDDGNMAIDEASMTSATWEIKPATVTVGYKWTYTHDGETKEVPDGASFPYDGKEYTVQAEYVIKSGYTGEISDLLNALTYAEGAELSGTNAGDYTAAVGAISVKDPNNYKVTAETEAETTLEWSIAPKVLTKPANKWDGEYSFTVGDGENHAAEGYVGIAAGEEAYFDVTYTYYLKSDTEHPIEKSKLAEAGDYYVYATVTVKDTNNFYFLDEKGQHTTSDTFYHDLTVAPKAEAELDLTGVTIAFTPATVTYDGQPHTATITGTDNLSAEVKALLEITYNGDKLGTDAAPTHAGTYTASLNLKKLTTAGYTIKEGTAPQPAGLTINKANVTVEVSGVPTEALKAGTQHELSLTVVVKAGALTLVKDTDYTLTTSGLTGEAAGDYTAKVTVELKKTDDYEFASTLDGFVSASKFEKSYPWKIEESVTPPPEGDKYWEKDHTFRGKDGDVEVTLKSGNLPKDHDLYAEKKPLTDEQLKAIDELLKDKNQKAKVGSAYDIHFVDKDGNEVKEEGCAFRVRIRIPENLMDYADDHLAVIHISDDGKVEIVPGSQRTENKKWMEFDASGFSIFAVIGIDDVNNDLWLILALALVALLLLIALIVLIVFVAKIKKEEPVEEEALVEEVTEAPAEEVLEETEEVEEEVPAEEPAEGPAEETPVVYEEPAAEEEAPVPVVVPEEESAAAVVVPVEETMTIYDRSFTARLSQAEDPAKTMYNDLKNYILSYKFVRSRVSWGYDSFSKGREKICKLQFKGKSLFMYIALDPKELDPKYHHKDVSDVAKYADVPTKLKVRSPRSLKYAKLMIDMLMQKLGLEQGEVENNNYTLNYRSTEQLIADGEIKVKQVTAPDFWNMDANDVIENSPALPDVELPEEEGKKDEDDD